MTKISRSAQARLLSGVGTAVLASMIATGAQAQSASTTVAASPDNTAVIVGHKTDESVQTNNQTVDASVTSASGGITAITDPGTQTGNSNEVEANSIRANATGQTLTNFVDLSLINAGADGSTAEGVASLGSQVSSPLGNVTSSANTNTLSLSLDGFQTGSAVNSGNTIAATTSVNDADSLIAGTVPSGHSSGVSGSSTLNTLGEQVGSDALSATGTIVVSTAQRALNSQTSASANGNQITTRLNASADNTITAAPELANNAISSSATVNSASNTASIESGDNPLFNGSAVVSNLQINDPDAATTPGATTDNSIITAEIGSDTPGVVNTLAGSLTVDGNAITSAASGNEAIGAGGTAGNRILLGDGMSVVGTGSSGSATIGMPLADISSQVSADLLINTSQTNSGVGTDPVLTALTQSASISADVQSIAGGTLDLTANAITATVRGNNASSAIASGDNAALFDSSVMIANQQNNDAYDLSGRVVQGVVSAVVGTDGGSTADSTVNVSGNTVSAAGYGNSASQDVALSAAVLDLDVVGDSASLSGGTQASPSVTVLAGAGIANLQSGTDSSVTVANIDSQISLTADSQGTLAPVSQITDSNLTVGNNRQEAVALGNSAGSSLSLEANDTGTGAGIASVQSLDVGSPVSASLLSASASLGADADVVNGQLAVTGNLQRAIGYGSSATNSVDVTANQLTSPSSPSAASTIVATLSAPSAFSQTALPTVAASFGVLNDQQTLASVTAAAEDASMTVFVDGSVADSSVVNDGNALVGAAFGNDANNTARIDVSNIDSVDGYSAVAAISNTQSLASQVTGVASGGNVMVNGVIGDVSGSSISTSGNAIQALATGNRAGGNILSVSGTNIDTAATIGTAGGMTNVQTGGDRTLTANASFSVQNAQSTLGNIQASQLDSPTTPSNAAMIVTGVTGDLTNSTVVSQGNTSTAQATANSAVSGVNIAANELATTTGVQNFQDNTASLSALIGLEGAPGTPFVAGTPDQPALNVNLTGEANGELTLNVNILSVTGAAPLNFAGASFTQREVDFLNGLAGISGAALGGNSVTLTGNVDVTNFNGFSFNSGDGGIAGDESITVTGFTVPLVPGTPDQLATPGTPNQGGVTIALGANITASRVAVDANSTAGSVIGNNAANSLMISANTIADGSLLATSTALDVGIDGATSDNSLSNFQRSGGAPLDSAVFGSFGIDGADGALVTDATLSVSDNTQSSTAIASTADNSVNLMGNSITAGSALASVQEGFSSVSAATDADLFVPAGVSGSTVELSGNTNSALAVNNDVTNTLNVSGTNVSLGTTDAANLALGTGDAMASGDHVLANDQEAFAAVLSNATTQIFNDDGVLENITGIASSSVTIANNRTSAEGSGNRAVNTMAVEGSAVLDASAGLANRQQNFAAVLVDATTSATLNMTGAAAGPVPAANGSTAMISGNSTTALARGNTASNALNVTAGSGYGAGVAGSAGSTLGSTQTVTAEAAVLNGQTNNATVRASSTGATYQVALNSGASNPGVLGSTVGVSGNMVAAEAYGNTATNRVTMTSLNANTPTAAVGNNQVNNANVMAITTSVTFGMNAGTGGIAGSTLQTTGNQISATAVGNSAVTSITGR